MNGRTAEEGKREYSNKDDCGKKDRVSGRDSEREIFIQEEVNRRENGEETCQAKKETFNP